MTSDLATLLHQLGPSLSSDLVQSLTKGLGLSPSTARKRVSRFRDDQVRRLVGLSLPKREAFLYFAHDFGTTAFLERLTHALLKSRSAFARPIIALVARNGAVQEKYLPAACGLPVKPTAGHLPYSLVKKELLKVGIIREMVFPEGVWIALPAVKDISHLHRATFLTEQVLLSVMKTWLGKVGWTSPHAVKHRDLTVPAYGQYEFDLVGPSYLSALVSYEGNKIKNGYIAADVVLGRTITRTDLTPFLMKWDALRMQGRATRLQPAFIAEYFEKDALQELRSRGCLVAIPETIFGAEVASLLKQLAQTLVSAADSVTNNPNMVWELFSKLTKLEGAAINLRGVFFEMIVAFLFSLKGYSVDLRRTIRVDGGVTDIDVKATNNHKVVYCECKAYARGTLVGLSDVEEWETKSLPLIKAWVKQTPPPQESRRFEFWSATDFTDDARQKLIEMSKTHLRQPVDFVTGANVLEWLRKEKQSSLGRSFSEQFGHRSEG